jgi:hypothetical protein
MDKAQKMLEAKPMKRGRTRREALRAVARKRQRATEGSPLPDSRINLILDAAGVEGVNHVRQATTALRRFSVNGDVKGLERNLHGIPQASKIVTQAKKYQKAFYESRQTEGTAQAAALLGDAHGLLKRAMRELSGQPDIKSRVYRVVDTVDDIQRQIGQ